MYNDRPIEDPRLQEALDAVHTICRQYDVAGAFMLVNATEAAFGYAVYATWNAIVEDDSTPMGFRIRVKTAEQGVERAQSLMEGTAHMLCQLKDFGLQTKVWMQDVLRLLQKQGIRISHTPFNGARLPRIRSHV